MTVRKFTVYVCKNGYLLNVNGDTSSGSYVHETLLKVLAHMADLGGIFDEDYEDDESLHSGPVPS